MTAERRHNTDGRIARGERTREAIVEAHAELLRSGVLKPTGKVIAEQAGISLRTVWLNFKDLEALLRATTSYWLDADSQLRRRVDPGLPLATRVDQYVDQRVRRLEHIAPAARSAVLGEPFSAALQDSRRAHVERSVSDLEAAFAAELDAAGAGRDALLKAMFVATSWPSWTTIRDDFGHDVDAATDVMRRSLRSLLRPAP